MTDRMADLEIERLADGAFELRQQDGSLDEPCRILLHPVQVRLLAERAGLLPAPAPGLLDRVSSRHVGRLHALRDRLHDIYDLYNDEIIDRCGSGIEISLHLEAIRDLVYEMLADVEAVDGNNNAASVTPALPAAQCHAVNSVTRKPGPKPSGKALTDAERQAKHRAKQTELQLPTTTEKEQPCPN